MSNGGTLITFIYLIEKLDFCPNRVDLYNGSWLQVYTPTEVYFFVHNNFINETNFIHDLIFMYTSVFPSYTTILIPHQYGNILTSVSIWLCLFTNKWFVTGRFIGLAKPLIPIGTDSTRVIEFVYSQKNNSLTTVMQIYSIATAA